MSFEEGVAYVVGSPQQHHTQPTLSNSHKLTFYALYKQATAGKCSSKKPSRLNVVAYAKVVFFVPSLFSIFPLALFSFISIPPDSPFLLLSESLSFSNLLFSQWNAWNELGNMSKEAAKKKYVETLTKLVPDWNKKAAKL
jgi:acyl-CoA-binding protein